MAIAKLLIFGAQPQTNRQNSHR